MYFVIRYVHVHVHVLGSDICHASTCAHTCTYIQAFKNHHI